MHAGMIYLNVMTTLVVGTKADATGVTCCCMRKGRKQLVHEDNTLYIMTVQLPHTLIAQGCMQQTL